MKSVVAKLSRRETPLASRLGRRLLGWFLLFSLVPLLGSNMLGYFESLDIIEGLVERHLTVIAESDAQHVRNQIDLSLLNLQVIAAGNEFLASGVLSASGELTGPMAEVADRPALEVYLARKLGELRAFEILVLHRRDGTVAASTGSVSLELGYLPSKDVVAPQVEIVMNGRAGDLPRLRFSVPLFSIDGRHAGSLAALLGPEGLAQLLEPPLRRTGSTESYLVDESGRLLYRSHAPGPVDYGASFGANLVLLPPGEFARYTNWRGIRVIGTSVRVGGLPCVYLVEYEVADALGPLQSLSRLSVLLGTLLAALLIIAAWIVAGGIVAPVRRLVAATHRVGQGDLDIRVDVGQRDEIGDLGRAFNDMTGKLARASAAVNELHQKEIERVQQLATVGELASGVAHEIKNPVVGISGGLDLVRRRVGDDETLAPIMAEMARQLERIESAVKDLLAFARPLEPNLEPSDADQIVDRVLRLVEPAAEGAGVSLAYTSVASPPTVEVDPDLIQQALVNLVINAVQATGPGGTVTLSTSARNGEVYFAVEDTGRGIRPEELEEIFKPFHTTRHSGTGLGLPISRGIVERHGGRIEVESLPAEGSVFTIVLPAQPPASVASREADF